MARTYSIVGARAGGGTSAPVPPNPSPSASLSKCFGSGPLSGSGARTAEPHPRSRLGRYADARVAPPTAHACAIIALLACLSPASSRERLGPVFGIPYTPGRIERNRSPPHTGTGGWWSVCSCGHTRVTSPSLRSFSTHLFSAFFCAAASDPGSSEKSSGYAWGPSGKRWSPRHPPSSSSAPTRSSLGGNWSASRGCPSPSNAGHRNAASSFVCARVRLTRRGSISGVGSADSHGE